MTNQIAVISNRPMARRYLTKISLILLLISTACAPIFAKEIAQPNDSSAAAGTVEEPDAGASFVIFSNLDSDPTNRYNSDGLEAYEIDGRQSTSDTETWYAIQFVPKVDVQARTLRAAIGYSSGTKLVNLGIYTHNAVLNTVGDPLPGGQGSTTDIPDLGTCCGLAKVTLAGEGVTLTGGTKYWLVASPDNVNGATFAGGWHLSNRARYASLAPPFPWRNFPANWGAAEIRGTRLQTSAVSAHGGSGIPTSNTVIFTNLGPTSIGRYLNGGLPINGNDVSFQPEIWEALPFTPRTDSHATTLAAAVAHLSGTKQVNLGIYSDAAGMVGTLLPNGQGTTTEMPESGECCALATVTLAGQGVALVGGTQYWLVASPDNTNAPTFEGSWQTTSLAFGAYQQPERLINWTSFTAFWMAAEIRGTTP